MTNRQRLYFLFFVSGFCSLVYQMVWTRLAFASFGIITPVLSVVISVFMLGLSVGSWAGGRIIGSLVRKTGISAIFFYGAAELIIGVGAFATPQLFSLGSQMLLGAGQADSFQYLLLSALVLAASILPWCICMGSTFPFMMAFAREAEENSADSFSYLYYANVLGAMSGTLVTAFVLIESMGFHHTLAFAAAGNFAIAAVSFAMGWERRAVTPAPAPVAEVTGSTAADPSPGSNRGALIRWILFTTGFSAMAMEVVWTRAFTPILKTQVYSFALIVFSYLAATFLGSLLYRRHLRKDSKRPLGELLALLGLTAFLPIIALDPRFLPVKLDFSSANYFNSPLAVILVLLSVFPMCGILGYLTPGLIDRYAGGHPASAGKAYGINVIGCILGPLFASYVLVPNMSERDAMVLLGVPMLALAFFCDASMSGQIRGALAIAASVVLAWGLFFAHDFEGLIKKVDPRSEVRRDYAASVISCGEGMRRELLVNGVGMTALSTDTKVMVHLPMSLHQGKADSALIICFGMGTSFRAALSWDLQTTAVELVPSVVGAFGYYHADTAKVLANPKGRIVIDDGRRFLERTRDKYDLIVIDPPPPVEAAGSSLLYSQQFYELAKQHLKPNGILQIWLPGGSDETVQAVTRSLFESFPYLRGFGGINGWGIHFLGSMEPLALAPAEKLAQSLPPKAHQDLEEWINRGPAAVEKCFAFVLSREAPIPLILSPDPRIAITDDQPYNEYYLLREGKFISH